jgi:hypothetical protein
MIKVFSSVDPTRIWIIYYIDRIYKYKQSDIGWDSLLTLSYKGIVGRP